jgi:hypothetical protein
VRSLKAFLLIDVLFLVACLFALYACARWLVRVERIWFESLEEYEDEDILSNYSVVKGKCALDLLSQQLY